MTSANPYFDPREDDDVFQTSPRSSSGDPAHTFDGNPCACGITHPVSLPGAVPPEILNELSEFIGKLGDHTVNIILTADRSMEQKLLEDFIDFAEDSDTVNRKGPLLRAITETIDQLVGKPTIGPLVKFYTAEQVLMTSHRAIRTIDDIRKSIADYSNANEEKREQLLSVLAMARQCADERLANAREQYQSIAKETDNTIDPDILDHGDYAEDASYLGKQLIQVPLDRYFVHHGQSSDRTDNTPPGAEVGETHEL